MSTLALSMTLALVACGDTPPSEPPPTPTEFKLPALDFEAIATERATRETAQTQMQRGYQCGWRAGWMTSLRAARHDGPAAFRSATIGSAFGWGAVLFIGGLAGTLLLAWTLPRMRRRAATRDGPKDPGPPTWASYFKGLAARFFSRLGRALRVEHFDPLLASERQRMVESCRDAERQLAVAHQAVSQLGANVSPSAAAAGANVSPSAAAAGANVSPSAAAAGANVSPSATAAGASEPVVVSANPKAPARGIDAPEAAPADAPPASPTSARATSLCAQIAAWRGELTSLRRRIEGPTLLPPELAPDRISPRLAVVVRAARDLRIASERAIISGPAHESTWVAFERDLADRPETPRDRATSPLAALAPWVRTTGYAGLGALAVALPMLACWMAAGAFPLFFALLFGLGGLGAVLFARVHLHRAGRLPLLPGFADRVASWLTAVLSVTLLVTMISSWMTSDGGLDMGDAPPVAMPDPRLLEAPRLFAAGSVPKPQPLPPAPLPTPAPLSTP